MLHVDFAESKQLRIAAAKIKRLAVQMVPYVQTACGTLSSIMSFAFPLDIHF